MTQTTYNKYMTEIESGDVRVYLIDPGNQVGSMMHMDSMYITQTDANNNVTFALFGDSAYKIKVVSTMPSTQDSNTLYFVTS